MKKLLIFLLTLSSCHDPCEQDRDLYFQLKKQHAQLLEEETHLSQQMEKYSLDNSDEFLIRMLYLDSLENTQLERIFIEIDIETLQKNSHCL